MSIYPFDYLEYLKFTKKQNNRISFTNYITFGGLPEVIKLKDDFVKNNYLKTTLESIIMKDILKRYSINDVTMLERIIGFLANNIGNLISIRNIYNYFKTKRNAKISLTTVSNYIKYLQIPYLINSVDRYSLKGKEILEQNKKYYFTDIGLRNTFGFEFDKDIGYIIENLVLLKLKKHGYDVYVGKLYNKEIDFVAKKSNDIKYIQVAYLIYDQKVKQREFGNLLSIRDGYEKIVISMDDIASGNIDGIKWINLYDFLVNDF